MSKMKAKQPLNSPPCDACSAPLRLLLPRTGLEWNEQEMSGELGESEALDPNAPNAPFEVRSKVTPKRNSCDCPSFQDWMRGLRIFC